MSELLKDRAYRKIREAILEETFQPGEFLSERRLIEYLSMSKTPIKSALDRLESEGFVTVSPKQGIIIKELSIDKIRDIFELRLALEMFVCEQICGQLRSHDIAAINENMLLQEQAVKEEDEVAFTKADADYHMLLCKASGNAEIVQILSNYQAHLYRSILRVIKRVPNRMEAALEDHRQIVDALVSGDLDRVKHLMRDHLDFARTILTT